MKTLTALALVLTLAGGAVAGPGKAEKQMNASLDRLAQAVMDGDTAVMQTLIAAGAGADPEALEPPRLRAAKCVAKTDRLGTCTVRGTYDLDAQASTQVLYEMERTSTSNWRVVLVGHTR